MNFPTLSVINSDGLFPYRNQAVERCLLESVNKNQIVLYLWRNNRTVVIGRNQNHRAECRIDLLRADGGFLARRISGGGAVYHDSANLNFSFIAPKQLYDLKKQLGVIIRAVGAFGIVAELSGRNDITVNGRKFSGNAFFSSAPARLHHGTILIGADSSAMKRYLSVPADKLRSKGVNSVESRVMNLRELSPKITVESMSGEIVDAFEAEYGGRAERLSVTGLNQRRISELCERFGADDWLFGSEPDCEYRCSGRFEWGGAELLFCIRRNKISECRVYSDCMDVTIPEKISSALTGCGFAHSDMRERLSALHAFWADDILNLLEDSIW